ncbi:sulfatase family protein [Horticoccus sp. 23ND18S-11]|uniref:sulfatase family protein n=1 Tax=Horticoccus sp. 23ND18S-11 TaxID=3391832 RepID=UPI0039C998C3
MRLYPVLCCLLACVFASGPAVAAPAAARPNVLVIVADDLGYGDIAAFRPQGDVRTPAVDRLAAEGMLFTTMRANCTVCSPTRAALLTGRHQDRVGVPGVIRTMGANSWGFLAPGVPTLADHLRRAGYHTGIVGKWHLGLTSPNTPNDRGFDFFHGFLGDMMDSYTTHLRHGNNYMRRNREVIDPSGHATEIFTGWAVDYLRERAAAQQPFFLYLAYNAPHSPVEPPAAWLERTQQRLPGVDPKRAAAIALVEHLDDAVGRVLATLRETGLDRTTLVVFTSDNGGSLPHAANNDPWRDGKQSHYDGGLKVPFVVRWPGTVAAGARSEYAGLVFDVFATCLEAAGVTRPAGTDAVSLLPVLRSELPANAVRDLYFVRREGGPQYGGKAYHALIRGDWKLLQNSPYQPLELYNLKTDPQEKTNVFAQNQKIARELQAALSAQIQRGGAVPWQAPETP